MRFFGAFIAAALVAQIAAAHGPQIQVNVEGSKIVSRQLFMDGDYSDTLTAPKSAYVMSLADYDFAFDGRPYSYIRANNVAFTSPGIPEYFSGPGLAYGYGWSSGNEPFASGTKFTLQILDSLKVWNGAAFVDAGAAEIQSFTGASPYTATNTALPGVALQFPTGAGISYGASNQVEAHATVRYRYLSNGVNGATAPDGVYLMRLQLTHPSATATDPFYYVLNKNSLSELPAAVASLKLDPALVQFAIPEPGGAALATMVCAASLLLRRRSGS
jgi:hypothetical protein